MAENPGINLGELNENSLQKILQSMVSGIEESRTQLFDVYEAARAEVEHSKEQLKEVRRQTTDVIDEVDALEKQEQVEKQNLVRVSSSFADYSEDRIHQAYDTVKNIQVQLGIAREKEEQLRRIRNQLEVRLFHLQKTLQGAERLAMRISSMLNFLSTSLSDVVAQLEAASKNKFLSAAIIHAQEEERIRVSRELHDGPAQDVANLLMEASICERLVDIDPDEAKESLQELRKHLRSCLSDVRQIIFDMRPMSLDDFGLVAAAEQFVKRLSDRGLLHTSMSVEGEEAQLAPHVKTALFRIVQEALGNIIRHAKVKEASLRMLYTEAALSILIEDKGVGFDVEAALNEQPEDASEAHFGILGMKERAMIIGAQLAMASKKGTGTRVHLRLPLKPEEAKEPPREKTDKRLPRRRVLHDAASGEATETGKE